MLSCIVLNLFWMGCYLECVDIVVCLLDVGVCIILLLNIDEGYCNEWELLLWVVGVQIFFVECYGDQINQENIESWLFFDMGNLFLVVFCFEWVCEGGWIVCIVLISQVWDVLNIVYQELCQLQCQFCDKLDMVMLIDFIMCYSFMVCGVINVMQLCNDGWYFINLGYLLECVDVILWLLDVKYYVLLLWVEFVGLGLDNYQWQVILCVLLVYWFFYWVYGGEIMVVKVVDFLILNGESLCLLLIFLYEVVWNFDGLVCCYGEDVFLVVLKQVWQMLELLMVCDIEVIFDEGLYEFLIWFIGEIGVILNVVYEDYFSGWM